MQLLYLSSVLGQKFISGSYEPQTGSWIMSMDRPRQDQGRLVGHSTIKETKQTSHPERLLSLRCNLPVEVSLERTHPHGQGQTAGSCWVSGAELCWSLPGQARLGWALGMRVVCCVWFPVPPPVFLIGRLAGVVLHRS